LILKTLTLPTCREGFVFVRRFAKISEIAYTESMNDETSIPVAPAVVSNIRDEDQFQDAITAAKGKSGTTDGHARYVGLELEIHAALSRQDSDATLTLITQ
jgi:hypothetical protein